MHTPGPWTVGNKSGRNCNIIFSGEHGVAGVYGVPMHCHISEVQNDPRYANPLSDAHLIAAAPDLLEALQNCLGGMEMAYDAVTLQFSDEALLHLGHHIAKARSAIAKATGK